MRRRQCLQENNKIRKGKEGRGFYAVSEEMATLDNSFSFKSPVGNKGCVVTKWLLW